MRLLHRLGGFAALFALSCLSPLQAAEVRVWTSASGSTVKAKLQKLDKGEVHLVTPENKVIKVKVATLSLADRAHLVDFAEADKKILTDVKLSIPEEDIRFDKKTIKTLEKKMGFGDSTHLAFNLIESEHFLIASTGRFSGKALAEMAERLWHGMAFQHMNFREDWGDKRKVIIVTTDEDVYGELGKWYANWLRNNITDENVAQQQSNRISTLWMRVAGTSIRLPEDEQEEFNAFETAKVFRIRDGNDRSYKKVFGPFPTHGLAGMLISHQMGGVSDISPTGYFALTTGHAYFKEIQLADKSETQLLDAGKYGEEDEISSASGFKDGRSWAKTLRKLVRQGKVTPDLEKLLSFTSADLTPEQLVLMYSFAYYIESDSARLVAFAEMVTRIESSNQVPAPIEIAKIFGHETVEEFQAAWTEFVKSTSFK